MYDGAVFVPADMPAGEYEVAIALLDPQTRQPKVKLAIAGMDAGRLVQPGQVGRYRAATVGKRFFCLRGAGIRRRSPPLTRYRRVVVKTGSPSRRSPTVKRSAAPDAA